MICRRTLSALEIIGVCSCYFVALWWIGPNVDAVWAKVAFYVLVAAGAVYMLWFSPRILHRDPPEIRGWGRPFSRLRTAAWFKPYGTMTLVGAAVLLGIALVRDPNALRRVAWQSVFVKFIFYLPFALIQAMFVFGYLMTRVRELFGDLPAPGVPASFAKRLSTTAVTSFLFCSLHMPNVPLMAFAVVAGFCWGWLFYRRPSVLLLTLSHATLGTVLHRIVELHTRIGPFYGHTNMHFARKLIPGAKALIGNLY